MVTVDDDAQCTVTAPTTTPSPLALAKAAAMGKCEFCEKSGLAILPVRPAIARPNSGVPTLPEKWQPSNEDKNFALPGAAAQYTARILRCLAARWERVQPSLLREAVIR